jgi:predicted ATP-grasp superfamily ATP-dependent carboligase
MTTALVTLGRLPKGLELARALAGAGCRVLVAEPWSWHLSRLSRDVDATFRVAAPAMSPSAYRDDLRRLFEREAVDLVVPVSEEILHVASLHGEQPAGVRVFTPSLERLLALHDKLHFARTAADLGLPAPATFAADSDEAAAYAREHAFIVKPTLSSAGKGLAVNEAGAPVPRMDEPALVQAFLPGEELSSFSIAHEGRVIGTVVYRGRIVSGTVAVCFEVLPAPDPALLEWVEGFVAGIGHSGFISFDFRRDAAGVLLPMECNPRTTSGIHFVHPDDLAKAILEPDAPNRFRLREERVLQQFFPALTETQGAFFKGRPWRGNLKYLFGCRDVCWSRRDPWPFLLLTPASWEILRRTLFRGMSFGEATTEDIGWYGSGDAATDRSAGLPGV